MKNDASFAYRRSAGHSATPVKRIVILYEQLIKDLRHAEDAMRKNDIQTRSREVDHALIVLARLQSALADPQGSEISRNLDRFYRLLRSSLLTAQIKNIPGMLDKQIKNLLLLREAWVEVDRIETERMDADRAKQDFSGTANPPQPDSSAADEPRPSEQWSG
jgi:flagellar secretion chaperone FliS